MGRLRLREGTPHSRQVRECSSRPQLPSLEPKPAGPREPIPLVARPRPRTLAYRVSTTLPTGASIAECDTSSRAGGSVAVIYTRRLRAGRCLCRQMSSPCAPPSDSQSRSPHPGVRIGAGHGPNSAGALLPPARPRPAQRDARQGRRRTHLPSPNRVSLRTPEVGACRAATRACEGSRVPEPYLGGPAGRVHTPRLVHRLHNWRPQVADSTIQSMAQHCAHCPDSASTS